jgi:hypothetical protein
MKLEVFAEDLMLQFARAAEAEGEAGTALADRLLASLDAAVRLAMQDVVAGAAAEITTALAPGAVEVRLRGRDLEFVVTPPTTQGEQGALAPLDEEVRAGSLPESGLLSSEGEDGAMTRINLRLPNRLKTRVEQAADQEGLSVNAWLVRAAAAAVDRTSPPPRHDRLARGAQRYRGWVK